MPAGPPLPCPGSTAAALIPPPARSPPSRLSALPGRPLPEALTKCAVFYPTPLSREWADYHLALGAGRLYVFDTDNPEPNRSALEDLIQEGRVEYYALPHVNPVTVPLLQARRARRAGGRVEGGGPDGGRGPRPPEFQGLFWKRAARAACMLSWSVAWSLAGP